MGSWLMSCGQHWVGTGGGRTGAGCVDKRGFSPLVRWCFFRPAREGKRADFGEGTRAGVARCRRVRTRSCRAGKRTSAIAADPPLTVPSPPALGSGAASAMSPSSQKIPVSADRLDETPDRPRARLFARVNRPSRAVEFTPNRVDDPSGRRGPPSHYAPTARALHTPPSECSHTTPR